MMDKEEDKRIEAIIESFSESSKTITKLIDEIAALMKYDIIKVPTLEQFKSLRKNDNPFSYFGKDDIIQILFQLKERLLQIPLILTILPVMVEISEKELKEKNEKSH